MFKQFPFNYFSSIAASTFCNLKDKNCIPCKGGVLPLSEQEILEKELFKQLGKSWTLKGQLNYPENSKLRLERTIKLLTDDTTQNCISQITLLAENQGHHPDLKILKDGSLSINLFTHKIQGLSESDFIFAYKLNNVIDSVTKGKGVDIAKDDPARNDLEYVKRRNFIANIAKNYRSGDPIPKAPYSEQEQNCYRQIYRELMPAQKEYAWSPFLEVWPLLNITDDHIPQLDEIDERLQQLTGFRMEPVEGLVPAKIFIANNARKLFYSAQFIRHHLNMHYTPEPDIIHEVLGHAASLGIKEIADLSIKMGKLIQTVCDECVRRMARVYWYTLEFGCVEEKNKLKTYGAGILSSFGELQQIRDNPKINYYYMDCPKDMELMEWSRVGMEVVTNYQQKLFVFRNKEQLYKIFSDYIDNFEDRYVEVEQCKKEILCKLINGQDESEIQGSRYLDKFVQDKLHPQTVKKCVVEMFNKEYLPSLRQAKQLISEAIAANNIKNKLILDQEMTFKFKNYIEAEEFSQDLYKLLKHLQIKPEIFFTWGKAELKLSS